MTTHLRVAMITRQSNPLESAPEAKPSSLRGLIVNKLTIDFIQMKKVNTDEPCMT